MSAFILASRPAHQTLIAGRKPPLPALADNPGLVMTAVNQPLIIDRVA